MDLYFGRYADSVVVVIVTAVDGAVVCYADSVVVMVVIVVVSGCYGDHICVC